jgi:hypothetical protein
MPDIAIKQRKGKYFLNILSVFAQNGLLFLILFDEVILIF